MLVVSVRGLNFHIVAVALSVYHKQVNSSCTPEFGEFKLAFWLRDLDLGYFDPKHNLQELLAERGIVSENCFEYKSIASTLCKMSFWYCIA
jgi:hypothetical protein